MNKQRALSFFRHRWGRLFLVLGVLLCGVRARALGTWTTLASAPPNNNGVEKMLLLSDGTVMAQQATSGSTTATAIWYRLTPDIHGSYINGTWSTLQPMNFTREFYSSAVLQDGRVFVAGGEYGTGGSAAEIYDPVSDTWTFIPVPPNLLCTNCGYAAFSDSECVILPNGNLLIAPVSLNSSGGTLIFDPRSNTFTAGPSFTGSQNEVCWVKLPDDSILTIDEAYDPTALNSSERFIPSLNNGQGGWIADGQLPVPMYNSTGETGAGVLLPDGRAWFFGGMGKTAYYTPSGNTSHGHWDQGPDMPSGAGWDEPAAMMVNGKVLYQTYIGPTQNPQPRAYYELDPIPTPTNPLGTITETPEWGDNSGYSHIMLNLPDGNVLVSYGSSTLRVYQPDGGPIPAGKPTITSITPKPDGTYHLTGTRLNGISQGSAFGDDAQMDSNYPLVQLTDGSGNVYFAKTYNWSSTSVATGDKLVSTEFSLPRPVAKVNFSLVVIANGISSDPVSFNGPVWVDFNYTLPIQAGTFDFPYNRMADGVANVAPGAAIFIKGPASSAETLTINKATYVTAVGGAITTGH